MTIGLFSARAVRLGLTAAACCSVAWVAIAGQAPPGPRCRTYSAEEVRTLSGAGSGTIEQQCRFDKATYTRACTINSRTHAGSFTLKLTDTYGSVGDFVDEIRVIPPIARLKQQTRRFVSGPRADADVTYEYDANRRQTRISTSMNGNLMATTYSAWDALGRPTSAVSSSRASTVTLTYSYDDHARTMTITGPAGEEVDTYNADGNMIHEVSTDGGGKADYAIRIAQTETICR
jgi:YD repeat-containing protein